VEGPRLKHGRTEPLPISMLELVKVDLFSNASNDLVLPFQPPVQQILVTQIICKIYR